MDAIKLVALLGLVAGIAYLVLAAVSYGRSRRRSEEAASEGKVVFSFEPTAILVEGEPTDERMRKLSTICASIGRKVFNEEFDYSVDSIARLDRIIVAGWGSEDPSMTVDVDPQVIIACGAYLGEVLVRRTRGRWVTGMTDLDPANVFFLANGDQTVSVSPFLLIRETFANMYRFDLAIAFTALEQKLKELKAA